MSGIHGLKSQHPGHGAIPAFFNRFSKSNGIFNTSQIPERIPSDNGPEFTTRAVREWPNTLKVKPLFFEPVSPWENGYIESFSGKLRDELLNREIFDTLWEAQVLIEEWHRE